MVEKNRKRFYQWIVMILIVLLALIFPSRVVKADNQNVMNINGKTMNLYGKVMDESGNPMQGVNVYFADQLCAITDAKGQYSIWLSPGDQGSLKFDQEIASVTSCKINYQSMYNIKLVCSFPSNNVANSRYEQMMNQKLSKIVADSNKNYEYVGSVVGSTNVIKDTVEKMDNVTQQSVKRIHISYADDNMAQNMMQLNLPRK